MRKKYMIGPFIPIYTTLDSPERAIVALQSINQRIFKKPLVTK